MAEHARLSAVARTIHGKQVKKIRREGVIPAVLYGPTLENPRSVSVQAREFEDIFKVAGNTALIDLDLEGETHSVFIRDVQDHPVRRHTLHIDFYAPNLNEPVQASVPVVTIGELPGTVTGVLMHGRQVLDIRALPDAIPQQIEVDISSLENIDDSIFISDLVLPEGLEVLNAEDELLVRLTTPRVSEEPELSPEEALAEESGDQPAAIAEDIEPVEE